MDFNPRADDRRVDLQAGLIDLSLPDGAVDVMSCHRVIETSCRLRGLLGRAKQP